MATESRIEWKPKREEPTETRPVPSPFRQVLDTTGWITIHDGMHYLQTETSIQNVSTGEVLAECSFLRGHLTAGSSLFFVARMSPYSACPDQPMLMRQKGEAFHAERSVNAHQLLITPYKQGTLGVVVPHRAGPPWGYELVSLEGSVTAPRPQKAPQVSGGSDGPGCYTVLEQPERAFGFESGALIVLGQQRCEALVEEEHQEEGEDLEDSVKGDEGLGVVAESWRPKKATSTITNLPLTSIQSSTAMNDKSVWVLGEKPGGNGGEAQTLLHFDGNHWEPVSLPETESVVSIGVGPNTSVTAPTLWLLTKRFLYGLEKGERLQLPSTCKLPLSFWFDKEEAWISCEEGVFTTDEQVALSRPVELGGDAAQTACEKWDPRPTSAPPPLFGPRTAAGCGQPDRQFQAPARPGKPQPLIHPEIGW